MIPKTMNRARSMAKTLVDVLREDYAVTADIPLHVAQKAIARASSRRDWHELGKTIGEERPWNPERGAAALVAHRIFVGAAVFDALAERLVPTLTLDDTNIEMLVLLAASGATDNDHRRWIDILPELMRTPGFSEFTMLLAERANAPGWLENNLESLDHHTDGRTTWEPWVGHHVAALAGNPRHIAWPSIAFLCLAEMGRSYAEDPRGTDETHWLMAQWFKAIHEAWDAEDPHAFGSFLWGMARWERTGLLNAMQHFVATTLVYALAPHASSDADHGINIPVHEMGALPEGALRLVADDGPSDDDEMNSGYGYGARWRPVDGMVTAYMFDRPSREEVYAGRAWLRATGGERRRFDIGIGPDPLCVDRRGTMEVHYRQAGDVLEVQTVAAELAEGAETRAVASAVAMEILENRTARGVDLPALSIRIVEGDAGRAATLALAGCVQRMADGLGAARGAPAVDVEFRRTLAA